MKVKFEEKTYESYFNSELDRQTDIFFPLGQVQEGFLGFDAAGFSTHRRLWHRLGFPFSAYPYFDGVPLNEIEHYMGHLITELPDFKVNLLFQYKRPEFIKFSSGKEWPYWKAPYYRYDIYQEQQQLLMIIHQQYNSKVMTLYASPAIHDVNDLILKKKGQQIIEFSNFQHCHLLNGHHRNTYVNAGMHSIACSDPENIKKLDLINLLNSMNDTISKEEDNRSFIINFRRQIESVMAQDNYYSVAFNELFSNSNNYDNRYPLLQSFRIMQGFKEITGIQWLIKA